MEHIKYERLLEEAEREFGRPPPKEPPPPALCRWCNSKTAPGGRGLLQGFCGDPCRCAFERALWRWAVEQAKSGKITAANLRAADAVSPAPVHQPQERHKPTSTRGATRTRGAAK
ncbi:MAG: hypothetical protein AB7J30_12585 [Hyphomicrobium sp.]|uniref:hypothetical protein n=1 Tax=Hyphomicrobium sp. TaxID=82 RepID=UPI003D100CED